MEKIYMFCSFISTTITALILSLLLPFQYILRRIRGASYGYVALYKATVSHERRHPVHHSFSHSVRYALIDLDAATHVPPNHLSADEARRAAGTNGPVYLLTIPASVGFEQNPVSLFYCYDVNGSTRTWKKCIVEVTNTPWGERVSFSFDPKSDEVAKSLHVSPFMDMLGNWNMRTDEPGGENLHVIVSVQHPKLGNYFTASLIAKRIASFPSGDYSVFFWLMSYKVAFWIYWHALELWWKNVKFIPHPKYTNPNFRQEAVLRDANIFCPYPQSSEASTRQAEESLTNIVSSKRWFGWRDAGWPWNY